MKDDEEPRQRWNVDAEYPAPVGPDLAVDGAWAGINFAVRGWRWVGSKAVGLLHRGPG